MDQYINALDKVLKVLTHEPTCVIKETPNAKSIALMRVNYAGEIAAQGLYLGAWCLESSNQLSSFYLHAMDEEFRHLDMCGDRVYSMGGKLSVFNPLWFTGAFCIGAASRLFGSGYALGFVAETEKQVLSHLKKHLAIIPKSDIRSRQVVEQMIIDEESHGNEAISLGATPLPPALCQLMHIGGRLLTQLSEWG